MASVTYSFSDINAVLKFPGFSDYIINGTGIGEISITYPNDNTAHALAADGRVMPTKIKADNRDFSIMIQQTSPLHAWLTNAFNWLMAQGPEYWAAGQFTISPNTGGVEVLKGVSFRKRADQTFQQQGQNFTWNFMATNSDSVGSAKSAITQLANNI